MDSEFGISARDVEAAEAETVRRLAAARDRAAARARDRAAELENLSPALRTLASGNPDVDINLLKAMDEQRIKSDLAAQEMNLKQQMNELDREPLS